MLQKKYLNGVEILSVNKIQLIEGLKKIALQIKKNHPEVLEIILFGSFVKDKYVPFSDIDIAIITKNSKKNFIQRQDEFIDYFLDIQIDVHLIIYTQDEFSKMTIENNKFIQEIKNGVLLFS